MELPYVSLPTASLVANDYNPNVVDEPTMEQLRKDISRIGVKQPIQVRAQREDGKYVIIDGEHRWVIATEQGIENVPCEILDISVEEAMIRTISMNRLRGEFDTIKLAEVLQVLRKTYSDEEITDLLGYQPLELKSYEDLLNFDVDSMGEDNINEDALLASGGTTGETLHDFLLQFTFVQLDIVESALEAKGGSRVEALVSICRDYLVANHPEKYEEVKQRADQTPPTFEEELDDLNREEHEAASNTSGEDDEEEEGVYQEEMTQDENEKVDTSETAITSQN